MAFDAFRSEPQRPDQGNVQRLDWEGLRTYWETHTEVDGKLDLANDPDALGNVVWPGQPLWLNKHMAGLQVPAYEELLDHVPIPDDRGGLALDIGCGSARWSRILSARGFKVTGIDLQEALIELNRRRFPQITFERVALQDFVSEQPFSLLSSVTVLQHNPDEQHGPLAERMRHLLSVGGHALILENVHDTASHVFSHSIETWTSIFEQAGFSLVATRPYDWSPFLRIGLNARRLDPRARSRHRRGTDRGPGPEVVSGRSAQVKDAVLRAAATMDAPAEQLIRRLGVRNGSVHAGFLFRAV